MKKIMLFLVVALGVMMTVQSCGMMSYAQNYVPYNGYGVYNGYGGYNATVQTMPNPNGVFVRSNNLQKTGTYVVGKTSYPTQLRWANLSLVKNGMIVYMLDQNGSTIRAYDMRVPDQNIVDEFAPVGLTGKPLTVTVAIAGGYRGSAHVVVSDGNHNETYYLME